MADEFIREFGRIERIREKHFINGRVYVTCFQMRMFDTGRSEWTDKRKYYDFYGDIPPEYVGQEAMYFRATHELDDLRQTTADIEIGKITPRREGTDGIYDIVANEDFNPTVPRKINSRFCSNREGHLVSGHEHK